MTLEINQHLRKTDEGGVNVVIEQSGGEQRTFEYPRSNFIFPAYHSLIDTLREYRDESISVKTSSKALADEYNAVYENRNATHLGNLMLLLSRLNIDLSVEYVASK